MSHHSRSTPIPDRPGHAAIGRKAVLGAVICAIIGTGCVWALGTRIWQLIQPATIVWDDVPVAEEVPPDLVNAIVRGRVTAEDLSDSAREDSNSGNRSGSRIAEERRLLGEMFPRHSETGNGSRVNEQDPGQPVRSAAGNRMAKIPDPIPDLEISIPEPVPANPNESVNIAPKSNVLVSSTPWRGAGDVAHEKPDPTKDSEKPFVPQARAWPDSPTESEKSFVPQARFGMGSIPNDKPATMPNEASAEEDLKFPQKFPGQDAVLPSASMRPPRLIQTSDKKPPVVDEQVEQANATSPLSELTDALGDSVQKLQRQPSVTSVMVFNQNRGEVSDERLVTVEEGDSFWTIAQRVYGDGNWFQAVYFENRAQVGEYDSLAAGQQLKCPSAETLQNKYPNLVPVIEVKTRESGGEIERGRVYCTMAGDTLFGVARQQLGQASRYMEIAELNRNVLGQSIGHLDPLPEGLKIVLPKPIP